MLSAQKVAIIDAGSSGLKLYVYEIEKSSGILPYYICKLKLIQSTKRLTIKQQNLMVSV